MAIRQCFECGGDIESGDYRMVGLDVPYMNLFFHKKCLAVVGGYGGINVYLTEHTKKVYNYSNNPSERRKNSKKHGREEEKAVQGATKESLSIQES